MELPKATSPTSPTPKASLYSHSMASGGDNALARHLLALCKGSSSTSFPQPLPQGSWLSPSHFSLGSKPSLLVLPCCSAAQLPALCFSWQRTCPFSIPATIHPFASPLSFTPSLPAGSHLCGCTSFEGLFPPTSMLFLHCTWGRPS